MSDVPKLRITLLGAGQEVGRSCCVLQYRGRTIVCDAGVHPAYSGIASLPFVDDLDWSTVDVLLITQCVYSSVFPSRLVSHSSRSFHLDHAAALTYIMEKVGRPLENPSVCIGVHPRADKLPGRQGKGIHDASH